ncbi:MAG: flagellar basal body P-ring formation protein FlgA [Gammaproteobacteria bacterium]|nr:flagellar basal body P-ring formation protein FlgA [Gammaproteobacteria bacterium]
MLVFSLSAEATNQPAPATLQSLDEIHNLVMEHIKQKVDQQIIDPKISIRKLNTQLHLQNCKTPLTLKDRNPNNYTGRMTITVHCGNPFWRVFVPALVDGKKYVVVSTKGILKGAVIKSEHIKRVLFPYKKVPRGSIVNLQTAVGMRTKKNIHANKIIKIKDLQPPYWVFKNQAVSITTYIGSIKVETKGIALKSGVEQQQIPVRNSSSKKVIKGIVIAPNHILIP